MKKRFLIYCDESAEKGKYFSNFYGGALLDSHYQREVEDRLNACREAVQLTSEIKWTKVSEGYLKKYIAFVDVIFDLLEEDKLKLRIMFTQNRFVPEIDEEYKVDNQYYLLYYQFIKHAFGLRYIESDADRVDLTLFLDDVPDKSEKYEIFKDYLAGLSRNPIFRARNLTLSREDITHVDSKRHVILQATDVVLGAMQFRLNDMHKAIPEGQRRRGKRTIAKEKLYKHVLQRIRKFHANFNIGISTGVRGEYSNRWHHEYRHWLFIPSDSRINHDAPSKKK
ncbi:DUF3800 domain-containing protein [Kordiimonas gwangyangensis]|uniref:DUF3800 domain-containing protein n=1 Tax=Kordiimonas gwangyangensis TaxID=288022 RepID=UPI00036A21A6|nr:DUF3800 domain-containing protein [Kordiimonas gwangyangensis]